MPVIVWLKWICGIDLIVPSRWIRIFGIGALLANVSINCFALYAAINSLSSQKEWKTVDIFSIGLGRVNFACYTLGIHSIFFAVSQSSRWKDLWNILMEIQRSIDQPYRRIRKAALVASALFLTV